MQTWTDIAKDYVTLAAPYIVPPLALFLATFIFKFLLSNKKTRQYAKLLMGLMQGKLEGALGPEKSKEVLEVWNEIVKEVENDPNGKSKAYAQNYFLTRMKNVAKLTPEGVDALKSALEWMDDHSVSASSVENYSLPHLPCPCEM